MILRTEVVEQKVEGSRRERLVKDVVMTSGTPLGMVRKRRADVAETKAAVILIHGFAQNRYTWHTTKRSFSAYLAAEGFDVFTAELRGHGRSRHFTEMRPRMLDEHIREDIPSFVREAIALSGHDKVFLVGHSMGGLLSYAAAGTVVREKVKGVISIGSPYRFGAGNTALVWLGKLVEGIHFTGLLDSNPLLPTKYAGPALKATHSLFDLPVFPKIARGWRPGQLEHDLLHEYLAHSFEATSVKVTIDLVTGGDRETVGASVGRLDYGVAFRAMDLPLLVIAGTEDALAPPPAVKRGYDESGSKDKMFRVYPLGHIDLILGKEAPTTVWPLIRDWLARRA